MFIEECRKRGRVTIDEAVEIADGTGVFACVGDDALLESAKSQKIRCLLSSVTQDAGNGPERAIRSVLAGDGRVYVDLFNVANLREVNLLIQQENMRIARSRKVITSLRKVKHLIQGQISLEELYGDAL
jgi:hypothetical protein